MSTKPLRSRKKQLNDEIRRLICEKYDAGKGQKTISEELDLNYNTVNTVLRLYKSNGRIVSLKRRKPKTKKISNEIEQYVKDKISDDASITLKKLKQCIQETKGVVVSISTIDRAISRFNFSFKRIVLIPMARNAPSNIEVRFAYANEFLTLDEEKIVFLDEMGVNCCMRLSYGRSVRGTSPKKLVKSIRSKNVSVFAAITKCGILHFDVSLRPFTGESFADSITNVLDEMERRGLSGLTFIMDNCTIHKVVSVRERITNSGNSLLFLPPYSPQLNPIEEFFSKWKHGIRALNCESMAQLMTAIKNTQLEVTQTDCMGFFSHTRLFALKAIKREEF